METTPSLSIESFSRSWLVKFNPNSDAHKQQHSCSDSFDASDESFIEMDPKLPASRRFYRVTKDFGFDFPASQSPVPPAEADELITDGLLMPLFACKTEQMCNTKDYNSAESETGCSSSPRLVSSFSLKEANPSSRVPCDNSLRRCQSVSKRIFRKYLDFFGPLCQKLRRRRGSGSRVASISSQLDPWYPANSSQTTAAWSADNNGRKFWDSECSITDAVLHCKKTNGCL